MKKILFGVLIFVVFGVGIWWFLGNKDNILSPSSNKKYINNQKSDLVTFGFLPTWMVGKTRKYGSEVSHLVFLGIEVDEEGNLIWNTQSKKINNQNYLEQKKLTGMSGGKNILGIKLFDDEKLEKLLNDNKAKNNLIAQVKQIMSEENFDGVNVDFEFQGDQVAILGEEFVDFLKELRKSDMGEISVDVFANTIIKGDRDNLNGLIENVDYLVVMAYDFHRPGVDYAGAVAPISSNPGERNINEVVESCINNSLDKNKIILAYPLYGYEWKTETAEFGSKIIRGWYQMASWGRVKELLTDTAFVETLAVKWDELSMSPWLSFEEEGEIHQIYFENEKSLKAKIDLVRHNQFIGYGFWALGYEGEDTSIWEF
jgi:spore germination protein YaaH